MFTERGIQKELVEKFSGKYFLIPLQVHNDSQVLIHSTYTSNEHFLEDIISSFASHAADDTILVIKHHPMDRGRNEYRSLIQKLAAKNQLSDLRWRYIHDQHIPTLLDHAQGVVVINSTVGIQALYHQCAIKVCGKAIYDIEGLTYQGKLAAFWKDARHFKVNSKLNEHFRHYVITHTQINGNIYKKINIANSSSGLIWPTENP